MSEDKLIEVRADEFEDRGCKPMMLFWYVNAGDRVEQRQDLCEVESAKAVFVIPAPVSGTLVEICVREAEPVRSGQILGRIEVA